MEAVRDLRRMGVMGWAKITARPVQWRPMAWVVKEEFGDHADVVFPKGLWGLTSAFAHD